MRAVRWCTAGGGLILVAALGAWAPAASASSAWLDRVDLSAPRARAHGPDVAMNAAGDAIVVWARAGIVQAIARPAGGPLAPRVDLTRAGEAATGTQVAIDDAGNAVVVWEGPRGVEATVRSASGSFSEPVNLAADQSRPRVAMDRAGGTVVVWTGSDSVQAAVRPAGGSFSAPIKLSSGDPTDASPEVAIDEAGDAIVVWDSNLNGRSVVQAAVRPAGRSFSAPVWLSAMDEQARGSEVAMGPAGDAVAVWRRYTANGSSVRAAVRPAGGSFSTPVDVAPSGSSPHAAVDRAGNAAVVWTSYSGPDSSGAWAAFRPAGGSFSTPVPLANPGEPSDWPRVAMDQGGNTIAVWQGSSGARAAVRPAGGSFSAAVHLSADQQGYSGPIDSPQVAMDAAGNGMAVWAGAEGSARIVQAAGHDGARPQLHGIVVPPTGVVGRPVSFAVSPLDVWSPITTSWAFGDGASTSDTAPTHTYAAPGTYTVGVSATDALANSTSATRAITITPAPASLFPSGVHEPRGPVISGLRLRPTAFRAARSGASAKAASARTGTRISYALDTQARVRFTVQRATSGRRVGKRCRKTTRANHARKPCTRFTSVPGSFTRARNAGRDRFTFSGRLGGRALRPGRHRLVVTPIAGTRTGVTKRAPFRILR